MKKGGGWLYWMAHSWSSNRRLSWEPIHGDYKEAVSEMVGDSSHAVEREVGTLRRWCGDRVTRANAEVGQMVNPSLSEQALSESTVAVSLAEVTEPWVARMVSVGG